MRMVERIAAPRPPEAPTPYRFPLVMSLAPVVASLAIWAFTGSAFALIFAALGPITAIAGVLDAKLGARRTGARERVRFAEDVDAARGRIRSAHERERAALFDDAPPVRDLLAVPTDVGRWTARLTDPVLVGIGTGEVGSAVQFETVADVRGEVGCSLDDLTSEAAVLREAPILVDARLGIGIVGAGSLGLAVARGIAVALARTLSPARTWCGWSGSDDGWLTELPHPTGPTPTAAAWAVAFGERGEVAPAVLVALAEHEAALPGGCRVVVHLTPGGAAITRHPDRAARTPLRVQPVPRAAARAWAVNAAIHARRDGLVADDRALPTEVALGELGLPAPNGLAAAVGVGIAGPRLLDLVAHGPHAVVGGTTGSGKSEFLVSWVLAMASTHSPEAFTALLIDFKGGAAFARLADLPHTVGIVTDLDERNAARALDSLRAELRYRERALLDAGATDVADTPGLPRLVILVDEFAAMLAERPELHDLFADLAARGRALGVHLVLCTQRPSGVVRDAVLANADLRICLRVNNRADSTAVVGTDAAAQLAATARGRGVVSIAGSEPQPVQFALSTTADVDAVARRWSVAPPPRKPWLPPLPAVVHPEDPAAFGVLDRPDEQRREHAIWSSEHGHVLVLGTAGSGASTALAALGGPDAFWIPPDAAAAWDALAAIPAAQPRVVLLDDADALLARFAPEYRPVVIDALVALLRDGGSRFAIAARRVTADLQPLAALAPTRLFLRHASRQEVVLAGGSSDDFIANLPPGGGSWLGHRVQVALTVPPGVDRPPLIASLDDRPVALVSTRVGALAPRLAGRVIPLAEATDPAPGTVLLGDPDEWQSRWGAIAALRPTTQILLDGCSAAEYRAVTRSRELPPPLTGHPGLCWRLEPDGSAVRVRLPLTQS